MAKAFNIPVATESAKCKACRKENGIGSRCDNCRWKQFCEDWFILETQYADKLIEWGLTK
jgi:hypothetical protein